jgi:hypothetical protein
MCSCDSDNEEHCSLTMLTTVKARSKYRAASESLIIMAGKHLFIKLFSSDSNVDDNFQHSASIQFVLQVI